MPTCSTASPVSRRPAVSMMCSGMPVDLDAAANRVARRAGNRCHDRTILADELIEQARLADIGLSDQDDFEALEQEPSLARAREQAIEGLLQALDLAGDVRGTDEVDVFLRKIERRFDEYPQLHQSIEQRVDLAREFADQAARCRANAGAPSWR